MAVHQREIVEVNFQLPNGELKPHPVLVISNRAVFETEEIFYGVMLSTKSYNEEFVFEITNEMLTKPSGKKSYAKCQLIQAYQEREIISRHGSLKREYFKQLRQKLLNSVLKEEDE